MPGNILQPLPTWLSRWLGYRPPPPNSTSLPASQLSASRPAPRPLPQYLVWVWSWIGAFGSLAVLQAVFGHARYFIDRKVPALVPSFGATAVLVYGVIDSPLAQPRNVFFGSFIGALTGVCISKLFEHLPTEARFNELAWLAASISCATTIVLMQMTKCVHPPSGATAILPILDIDQRALGWYYIPVVLLSAVLAVAVGLVTNNVQRRYPAYWIEPPVAAAAPAAKVSGGGGGSSSTPESTRDVSRVAEKKLFLEEASDDAVEGGRSSTGRTSPTTPDYISNRV